MPAAYIMEGLWMNLQFDLHSFVDKCFTGVKLKQIENIQLGGACLVRRIMSTKTQLPDSFPYVIERDFGEEVALEFEQYVATSEMQSIDNLEKGLNFQLGVDHMN